MSSKQTLIDFVSQHDLDHFQHSVMEGIMLWRDGGAENLELLATYILAYAKKVKIKEQMLTLEDYVKAINR